MIPVSSLFENESQYGEQNNSDFRSFSLPNDLHSHLLGYAPNIEYTPLSLSDNETVGGWARIAAVISKVRVEKSNPVRVVLLILAAVFFLVRFVFGKIKLNKLN